MINKYGDFIIFNLNQAGAAKAMASIDSSLGAGNPTVYGDVCCVGFWVREGEDDQKYVKDQINKCKKILNSNNVSYKYAKFNV